MKLKIGFRGLQGKLYSGLASLAVLAAVAGAMVCEAVRSKSVAARYEPLNQLAGYLNAAAGF